MKKIIPKFRDLCENITILPDNPPPITVSVTNIDDIFAALKVKGVDDVRVNWYDMLMISRFCVANMTDDRITDWSKIDQKVLKILKEGKVDSFLGVKLHLNE